MGPKRFALSVDDDTEFRSRCEWIIPFFTLKYSIFPINLFKKKIEGDGESGNSVLRGMVSLETLFWALMDAPDHGISPLRLSRITPWITQQVGHCTVSFFSRRNVSGTGLGRGGVSWSLDPHTKMMSFCENKYFPSSWKDEVNGFLSMDCESFYVQHTQGEVNHEVGQVPKHDSFDDLLVVPHQWMSTRPLSTGRPN
jgi:hypothetical protein